MKDKEIELKFVINEKIKDAVIKDLKDAKYLGETHQVDTYYIPDFRDFEKDGETVECVRIREDKNGVVLCYKKIHREANPVYCDEYETKIEDKDEMEKILFAFGFTVQMIVDKTRNSYALNNLRFDFDSVKSLGELMEVELKGDDVSVDDVYMYVKKYGLSKENVTYDGIQKQMKEVMRGKGYDAK
ncbi:MAG: class IV adenylate cyclase [Clostridia bacterium]|nr:class IV adenylate cyclase [Clostridia bacterium]